MTGDGQEQSPVDAESGLCEPANPVSWNGEPVMNTLSSANAHVRGAPFVVPVRNDPFSPEVPGDPGDLDDLASSIRDAPDDEKALCSLESFLDECRATEARLSGIHDQAKADRWSYPESITATPRIPDPVPPRKPLASHKVQDVIRKLRGELARILAGIDLVEAAGRKLDGKDVQAMTTAFTALLDHLTPLSAESAVDLKMAALRLDVQVLEVQVSRYRDMAQKCRDIVDAMRRGYHVSRTAHQVALKTADDLYDAYLEVIRRTCDTVTPLTSTDLPKAVCSSLEKAGCWTIGDLALLSSDRILSIHGIGEWRLETIRQFFRRHGLPALCLWLSPLGGVSTHWTAVNCRNEDANYQWRAPKCYGDVVFEAPMNGQYSFVYANGLEKNP